MSPDKYINITGNNLAARMYAVKYDDLGTLSSLAEIQTENANVKIGIHSWKLKLAATLQY